jgi:flavin reductase (DIM6/NTAB) family NADH-FMN oxidoreductase RutF
MSPFEQPADAAEIYFYDPRQGHGLPHDPFKAIVAPRPIGWISTVDAAGRVNLAPYSFFNGVSSNPPIVGFSSEGRKDSLVNAEATGEFVCNLATEELAEAMNRTSAPVAPGVDEMTLAGLEAAPSRNVRPPRVARTPAALECRVTQIMQLTDVDGRKIDNYLVLGQVVGVHLRRDYIKDGRFDTAAARPIARCGYRGDYTTVTSIFEMIRPKA